MILTLRQKILLALLFLFMAFFIGTYFSGWILLLWIKNNDSLSFITIFKYLYYYGGHASYGTTVMVSAVLGYGIVFLSTFGLIYFVLFRNKHNLYGKARFAKSSELKKAGFFKSSNTGIVVGKKDGKYLFYSGQQFALLAAPTRSGKGVGIVVPNLLSYQGSIVVLDIKQENFKLTSGFRRQYGQEVYLFNPFAEDKRSHRWNPLSYVSTDPNFRVSDLMSIANMLYPIGENPKDRFWLGQAQNVFLALALFLFESSENDKKLASTCTMGELLRTASGDGGDLREYFQGLASLPFLSETCRTAFAGILGQAEETFGNIMATFKEPLLPWLNPVVDAATSANDFLLTDVRKRKMTIYIGVQPNKLAESRLIINLFFSQLINQNTKELPQDNTDLKYQCLLLMDEFTSIGAVDIIAKSVSYMAGYNIRLFPIIQSLAQLDAVYGKEVSRTIVTNHALQIIYTPREQRDANEYSEMLGYTAVKKANTTRGTGQQSINVGEERRSLMLPQELKAMPNTKEIFIYEGLEYPVMCDKIRYYEDSVFAKRVVKEAPVPDLIIQVQKTAVKT